MKPNDIVEGDREFAFPESVIDLLSGMSGFRRMIDGDVLVEADGNIEGVPPVFLLR